MEECIDGRDKIGVAGESSVGFSDLECTYQHVVVSINIKPALTHLIQDFQNLVLGTHSRESQHFFSLYIRRLHDAHLKAIKTAPD
jgi:hypothetical protein